MYVKWDVYVCIYVYLMKYYLDLKKNILPFTMWMNLEDTYSVKQAKQKEKNCMIKVVYGI